MKTLDILSDPQMTYQTANDKQVMVFIDAVRQGISYSVFKNFSGKAPFTMGEWCTYLHLSERTMQRYHKEQKTLDSPQSEKFLEIVLLYKKGIEVFGDSEKFDSWLDTVNIALGKTIPKSLLDSSFGIHLLKDELTRIEQGVLA